MTDPRPDLAATIGPLVEMAIAGGASMGEAAAGAFRQVGRLGYRSVAWPAMTPGLRPRDLDATARRGIASELRRHELTLASVDLWIPPGHFLDPEHLDRAVTAVEAAVAFAGDLARHAALDPGSAGRRRPIVSTLLPSEPERRAAGRRGEELAQAIAALAAAGERAGIAIADHAPESSVNPSPLASGVDPAACLAAGRDPAATVLAAGRRLAAARLVDLFRSGLRGAIGEPGEARLDIVGYRVALDVIEFRGATIVDSRQWRDPSGGLAVSLERWAGAVPEPGGRERGGVA